MNLKIEKLLAAVVVAIAVGKRFKRIKSKLLKVINKNLTCRYRWGRRRCRGYYLVVRQKDCYYKPFSHANISLWSPNFLKISACVVNIFSYRYCTLQLC
jgi:hypothetical protein